MLAVFLIAVSLSIDALGIGLTYGMRKIIVPIMPKIIISFISAAVTFLSLSMGNQLQKILPDVFTKIIGVFILLCMGIYLLAQSFRSKNENSPRTEKKQSVWRIAIKSLNLTIQIIHEPQLANVNNSKKIEPAEAFCVGCALSIDSVGSGIGLSMLGFSNFYLPAAVAICQYIFLSVGILSGRKLSNLDIDNNKFVLVSGLILIFIAATRII